MSEPVTQSDVEDVLSSIRRLVGDTRQPHRAQASHTDNNRLVLTPQLRVSDQEVLMLKEADEVAPLSDWQEFEEPPLVQSDVPNTVAEDAGAASEEPLLLVSPAARKPMPRTDLSELTAKIAALETAIAKTVDQWEPDGAGRDAYAGTQSPTMTWQENVELDATGKPMPGAVDHASLECQVLQDAEEVVQSALDEQIIDEDTLREIVAEIVRAELQGALGERITRNVRKLVRREIHRALTAQSLE